jgi:hypothetical protein
LSRELEGLLYFGVMGLVFFLLIIFAVIIGRKRKPFLKSSLQLTGFAILLYGIASLWWFSFVEDGLGQLFGVMYYGIAFVVNIFVNIAILYFTKKSKSIFN